MPRTPSASKQAIVTEHTREERGSTDQTTFLVLLERETLPPSRAGQSGICSSSVKNARDLDFEGMDGTLECRAAQVSTRGRRWGVRAEHGDDGRARRDVVRDAIPRWNSGQYEHRVIRSRRDLEPHRTHLFGAAEAIADIYAIVMLERCRLSPSQPDRTHIPENAMPPHRRPSATSQGNHDAELHARGKQKNRARNTEKARP